MLNLSLLNEALERIRQEPHRWNQNSWVANEDVWNDPTLQEKPLNELCGTQMCLAGHVLLATDTYVLAWKKRDDVHDDGYSRVLKLPWFFNILEGEWAPSADVSAAEALGLSYEDEDDALLISQLFLTTGYSNTIGSFEVYEAKVRKSVQAYYRNKAESLAARVMELEAQIAAQTLENAVNSVGSDPWAALTPSASEEPPF